MLENASQFNVQDVTQVNAKSYHRSGPGKSVKVRGDYTTNTKITAKEYHHHEARGSEGLKELYAHVAPGCMHNSADRVDAPKCHKETRKAVQEDIFSWISDGPPGQILWLTGPAGSGKSAIMGTVSDKCRARGQLVATFFFAAYSGSVERKSKRRFVTTLAYQAHQYPGLGDRFSQAMLTAVQKDPAIFQMSLEEQIERLVLHPLGIAEARQNTPSNRPMVIIVDGVDECGEDTYNDPNRSKQKDQLEVLLVLLRVVRDSSSPFRIIIASRPETWIRNFFTHSAAGEVTEIFLDDKYNPDDDVRLFFKSKFAEISRRYGYPPSTWPREEDIDKLVADASGQFIYAATVIRFIDTPSQPPQAQLKIVLKIEPQDMSRPFALLDALYTSILRSSPNPSDTVLWIKAQQLLSKVSAMGNLPFPSAWSVDRFFEATPGQAQILLGLPSLIYIPRDPNRNSYDSFHYGESLKLSASLIPKVGWNAGYAFYHKSFLDYLQDPLRCGAAFPSIDEDMVKKWVWERCTQVLKSGGPEVPTDTTLLSTFKCCFIDLFVILNQKLGVILIKEDILRESEPMVWLTVSSSAVLSPQLVRKGAFEHTMFRVAHKNCRPYRPCNPGCKRWREAISDVKRGGWKPRNEYSSSALLFDRFCLSRVPT